MGLGKTVTTLTAINRLMFEELDILNVLVIGPKRVAESVWDAECANWAHLKDLKISKITGTPKQRLAALRVKADIYTIGRDNIAWLCGLYGGSMLPFDALVIDELTSFKNPNSVRFKALRAVQPSFKRVIGLTGTPAPNGLIDLWSQVYLLDRGERLGKFVTKFREAYFSTGARNGDVVYNYVISDENKARIYDKISDICMSMKAADYLQLPGRIDNIIRLSFPPDIQDKYDEFEREKVLEFLQSTVANGGQIAVTNAAALSNKLQQFANGAVYDENKTAHAIHDLKIEALKDILEEANGKPVLLAWTFRSDMYRIKEVLAKYGPRELKTDQDIKDWNAGKIKLLMMHPASGGHGLNLQAGGNIIVWFGLTWSLELEQQFNARLDRQGQKEVTIIHRLVVNGTVENDILRTLGRKESDQNGLMSAVKALVAKHAVA